MRTSKRRQVWNGAGWLRAARAAALPPALVVALGLVGLMAPTDAGSPLATDAAIGPTTPSPPVPATGFETPASETRLVVSRGPGLAATPTAASGTTLDIPDQALAAYQRAAVVMEASDPDCNLSWELIAAIGRVESDHGRYGGSRLDESGRAQPAIVGIRLDGRGPVAAIRDTDAGEVDGDTRWDRAVGPMQFIPATWLVVGVDADGDGRRDPQDIDDAALAAAVYLCAGTSDLATEAGRQAAVHSYNHDDAYVALVLRIFATYVAAAAEGIAAMPAGTLVVGAAMTAQGRTLHPSLDSGIRDDTSPGPAEPTAPSDEPAVDPPAEEPPAEQPPAEEPPAEEPPAEEPPAEEPPAEEPPAEEPPAEEPPAEEPPAEEPPAEEPPAEEPPLSCEPAEAESTPPAEDECTEPVSGTEPSEEPLTATEP